ncbi:MAG: ACT domain-containing protein [Candidatus Methanomethylophilaceae archaeon]|nr:ACT domain-containing protein [Candidatus Methanomethylophilaceae archaeon]
MNRIIITLVGKDRVGLIATMCNYLAQNNINILDIKQTTVQEYINMMMIVDIDGFQGVFSDLASGLESVGESIGCIVKAHREDIFNMMHRI